MQSTTPRAPSAAYQRFIHRLYSTHDVNLSPPILLLVPYSLVPVSHTAGAVLEFRKEGLNCVLESLGN